MSQGELRVDEDVSPLDEPMYELANGSTMERRAISAAYSLSPRELYWAVQRVGIQFCGGPNFPDEVVPAVPYTKVLQRLEKFSRTT